MWNSTQKVTPHVREAKSRGFSLWSKYIKKSSTKILTLGLIKNYVITINYVIQIKKNIQNPSIYLDVVQTEQSRNLDCNLSNKSIITVDKTNNLENNSIASKELKKKKREARICCKVKRTKRKKT